MTSPYITVDGTAYAVESLSERARTLSSDLLRTIQEYRAMFNSYREQLTLTGAYTGGLKEAVEKAELPIVISPDSTDKPIIKIDEGVMKLMISSVKAPFRLYVLIPKTA